MGPVLKTSPSELLLRVKLRYYGDFVTDSFDSASNVRSVTEVMEQTVSSGVQSFKMAKIDPV